MRESLTCCDIPLSAFTDLLLAKLWDSRRSSSAIWDLVLEVSDAADMSDATDSLFDVDDVSDNVDGDLVSFVISGEGSGDGGGEWASSLTGGGASSCGEEGAERDRDDFENTAEDMTEARDIIFEAVDIVLL